MLTWYLLNLSKRTVEAVDQTAGPSIEEVPPKLAREIERLDAIAGGDTYVLAVEERRATPPPAPEPEGS